MWQQQQQQQQRQQQHCLQACMAMALASLNGGVTRSVQRHMFMFPPKSREKAK